MNRSRQVWCWLLACATVFGLGLFWLLGGFGATPASVPQVSPASEGGRGIADAPGPASVEATGDVRRTEFQGGRFQVRVVDGLGAAIGGAHCALVVPGRRAYRAEQLANEVLSQGDGTVQFASDMRGELSNARVIVWKAGFQPSAVDGAELVRSEMVELRLIAMQQSRVLVKDGLGNGIAGVSVALSRMALPAALSTMEKSSSSKLVPGLNPEDAIHVGLSNVDGEVNYEGLSPGLYVPSVLTPGFVIASGTDGAGYLTLPGRTPTLGLVKVWACCGKVDKGTILSYVPYAVDGGGQPPGLEPALRRMAGSLRSRLGGDLAYATVDSFSGSVPASLRFRCLVSGAGWCDVELPLKPVSELRQSSVIVVDDKPRGLGQLLVELVDQRDEVIDGERLFVYGPGPASGETAYPISTGVRYGLPPGAYSVKVPRGAAIELGERNFEIKEGDESTVKIRYSDSRARCTFRVLDRDGEPVSFATFSFRAGQFSKHLSSARAGDVRVTLPVGLVEVSVFVFGAGTKRQAVTIGLGPGAEREFTITVGSGS